jgi:hypothetical protein
MVSENSSQYLLPVLSNLHGLLQNSVKFARCLRAREVAAVLWQLPHWQIMSIIVHCSQKTLPQATLSSPLSDAQVSFLKRTVNMHGEQARSCNLSCLIVDTNCAFSRHWTSLKCRSVFYSGMQYLNMRNAPQWLGVRAVAVVVGQQSSGKSLSILQLTRVQLLSVGTGVPVPTVPPSVSMQ